MHNERSTMAPTEHSSFEIACGFLVALPGSPGEGLYHLPLAPAELLEEGKPLCCHLMAITFLLPTPEEAMIFLAMLP